MANQHNAFRIDAVLLDVRRIAQKSNGGLSVLDGIGEGKSAGASLRAAIVREQDIPAGTLQDVSQIHVLFVTRESVEKECRRMWSATGSEIKDGVEPGAVAQNVRGFHDCGGGLVGQGIGGDGGRELLR